jgi:uncharacterized protein (DUF1778 family)
MSTTKEQRLQIRVDPDQKQMIERAANATRQNLSAFVLQAASGRAAAVLADRQAIELSPEAARAFNEALVQPARVNERLAQALKKPRSFSWLD